jgi:hypothetical protein
MKDDINNASTGIHMWIARDSNGLLKLFKNKPDKQINNLGRPYVTYFAHDEYYILDPRTFTNTDVNSENSPIEIILHESFKQLLDFAL